jgi:hypothetical protein
MVGMVVTFTICGLSCSILLRTVLGVGTPGQQVPPRVRYGTTCLIIRDAMGSVPCSDEWEFGIVTCPGSYGARGAIVP